MRTRLFLLAVLTLFSSICASAATLTYHTDGCNEYFIEQMEGTPNSNPQWRIIHKCCGAACFTATAWTDQVGPVSVCGTAIYPPSGGGSGQLTRDPNGNVLVDVPSGRGGVVTFGTAGCHPFTPNGSAVISLPAQMFPTLN